MAPERPSFRHEPGRHGLVGPFSGRQLLATAAAVVAAAVVLVVVTRPLGNTGAAGPPDPQPTAYVIAPAPSEGLHPGQLAPELAATRPDGTVFQLTDLDGNPVRLADLRGRAVWLDFWASWCPPCQAETPVIRDVAAQYSDRGLTVIGISVQEASVQDVRDYAQRYGLGYTVAADLQADVFHRYRVYALPTQFFIAPDGVIRAVVQGPLDRAGATVQVEAILPKALRSASSSPEVPGSPPASSAP